MTFGEFLAEVRLVARKQYCLAEVRAVAYDGQDREVTVIYKAYSESYGYTRDHHTAEAALDELRGVAFPAADSVGDPSVL